MISERNSQALGPIDHRRKLLRGGKAEPHSRGGHQVFCLHDRIGEVSRANHHSLDLTRSVAGQRAIDGSDDP